MEILILAGVAFVFYVIGINHGWHARERKMLKENIQHIKEVVKEEQKNVVHISIEQHGDVFFVYDKKTNTFMCQGKNKEELEDALSARYPGKRFAASEEDLEKAGLLP